MQHIIGRATHYNPVLISDTPSGRLCHSTVCYPNPCQNGAQCIIENNNEFSCNCLPGWTGRVCDSPINYCRDSREYIVFYNINALGIRLMYACMMYNNY